MFHYRICGLDVASELELPGAIAVAAPPRQADVAVRRAQVPADLAAARVRGPNWAMEDDRFLLHIPQVARFLLTRGCEIAMQAEPGADEQDSLVFLLGSAFGILLHQRAQIVLQASAVSVNGKAVLFCGPSGAGKSTLAAALAQRGFPLMTDDVCAITVAGDGTPMVHPDGHQLKLWTQAIERLDLTGRRGERVRNSLEKFYVEPGEAFSEPLPLAVVYALREARPPHAPGIERPNVVDAALVLRRSAYRPLLVDRMGQKTNYFRAATTIANSAGIFHLTRTLDFEAMPEVVSWLQRYWLEIGLLEKAA